MSDLKEKIKRQVSERNLCSCMNNTKWRELRDAMMSEMPFSPPYMTKFLFEETESDHTVLMKACQPYNWYYVYSVEGECFDAAFAIEWIRIFPRIKVTRSGYPSTYTENAEKALCDILNKYSIPFEKDENGIFCIYGYR